MPRLSRVGTGLLICGFAMICPLASYGAVVQPEYARNPAESVRTISLEDLREKIKLKNEKKLDLAIVDLRIEAAFLKGALPGAINIPLKKLSFRAEPLIGKDTEVVVYGYSATDRGSINGAIFLLNIGYQKVYYFPQGYEGWVGDSGASD